MFSLGSYLLHSKTVEGKNEFFKKLCFILSKRTFSTFLVLKAKVFGGTMLERYLSWLNIVKIA